MFQYCQLSLINAKEQETDTQLTKDIKNHIKAELATHNTDYASEQLLSVAMFLHPIFKNKCLSTSEVKSIQDNLLHKSSANLANQRAATTGRTTSSKPEKII